MQICRSGFRRCPNAGRRISCAPRDEKLTFEAFLNIEEDDGGVGGDDGGDDGEIEADTISTFSRLILIFDEGHAHDFAKPPSTQNFIHFYISSFSKISFTSSSSSSSSSSVEKRRNPFSKNFAKYLNDFERLSKIFIKIPQKTKFIARGNISRMPKASEF